MKTILYAALAGVAALSTVILAGCSRGNTENRMIAHPADLVGGKCAVVVGSMMGDITVRAQPGIGLEWFNDYNSGVEAVRLGKIDAMPLDFFYANRWVMRDPRDFAITEPYSKIPWAYFFAKGSPLCGKVNAILSRMRESGELERVIDKWMNCASLDKVRLEEWSFRKDFTGKAGVFRFATPGDREPVCFTREDGLAGFDIDIARRIAYELDMKFETVRITMGALASAIQTGKADMGGGGIAITAERAEKVDFSESYYQVPTVFLINRRRAATPTEVIVRSPADLVGRKCGVMLGTCSEEILLEHQKGVKFMSFNDMPAGVEALKLGKIDAFNIDGVILRSWAAQSKGRLLCTELYSKNPAGFIFPKGSPLREKVNAIIRRMSAEGELKRIIDKWCEAEDLTGIEFEDWAKKFPDRTGKAGKLVLASTGEFEPGSFMRNGKIVGFDIDLVAGFARELDMELEVMQVSASAIVPTVQTGKADMGADIITITEERARKIDYSEKYLDDGLALLVRNPDWTPESANVGDFIRSLGESFRRTFVVESRWQLMASGLGVTMLITVLAALLGTILAFPVWLARTSRVAPLAGFAKVYIAVLQGTPVLVLLMVLFYLVFGKVDMDGIWVAVIGFGLNLSAYAGEMLRSGVNSIPVGQTEAALALGYPPHRAFTRFVLPQAIRSVLPVYRGELIGLLKMTSIVGYIAICDLTKASDLVRSRTYESFFPLITTAIVYFLVSWLMAAVLEKFGARLDPASRRIRKSKEGAGK